MGHAAIGSFASYDSFSRPIKQDIALTGQANRATLVESGESRPVDARSLIAQKHETRQ
jgi:hypothetical protein